VKLNPVIRSYSVIVFGTAIAQAINLVSLFVFSRIYEPSDFGAYQLYFSILNVLLMIACFRYEVALLKVKDGSVGILFGLIFFLCSINTVFCILIVLLLRDFLSLNLNVPILVLYILPLALMLGGIHQASIYQPIRDRRYRLAGAHKVSQSGAFFGVGLVLAYSSISGVGLIISDVMGRVFSVANIFFAYKKSTNVFLAQLKSIDFKKYTECAKQNLESVTLIFPGTLISSLVAIMLPLFLANQYSIDTLGQYSLVERFVIAPITIFSVAISQVITGDFSDKVRKKSKDLQRMFRKLVIVLIITACFISAFCWFLMPAIFGFAFEEKWSIAGELAKYSAPYLVAVMIATPVNMLLIILGKNIYQLIWEVIRFLVVSGFFLLVSCYLSLPLNNALLALGTVYLFCYAIFIFLVDKAMGEMDSFNKV